MSLRVLTILSLLACLILASARHGESVAASSPKGGAVIQGMVRFEGSIPPRPLVKMTKEPFCAKKARGLSIRDETVIVNPNRTLRNVVVFLQGGAEKSQRPAPRTVPVVLDQYNCWFRPHVLGIVAGESFLGINDDPGVLHNFHFQTKINPPLNFSLPGETQAGRIPAQQVVFKKPEMIPVMCEIHPWMHAVIAVMPNPYFSITDRAGTFRIAGIPPGSYVLEAWHEKYGKKTERVSLSPGQVKAVTFTFSRR